MAALATLVGGHLTNASAKTRPEVRLVLQITIDGLRADLINRYEKGFGKGPVKVMHGSPWRYDTHVPIIFMGPGIKPQTVHRRVHPVDVAPTIAALLGMTPPGSAQGLPLVEVSQ
jgi:predicted AlkP superfamily pyrophosphatase or phosphodiesterase